MKKILLSIMVAFFVMKGRVDIPLINRECNDIDKRATKEFFKKCISSKTTKEELFIIRMYLIGLYTCFGTQLFRVDSSAQSIHLPAHIFDKKQKKRINKIIEKINTYIKQDEYATDILIKDFITLLE